MNMNMNSSIKKSTIKKDSSIKNSRKFMIITEGESDRKSSKGKSRKKSINRKNINHHSRDKSTNKTTNKNTNKNTNKSIKNKSKHNMITNSSSSRYGHILTSPNANANININTKDIIINSIETAKSRDKNRRPSTNNKQGIKLTF